MNGNHLSIYSMAECLCIENDINYEEMLDYNERFGYILSSPSMLIMAHIDVVKGENCWFVELLIGDKDIPYILSVMPVWCDKIRFARPTRRRLKPKTYETERICHLFGVDPKPLKAKFDVV